jgi:hypothetical protein
MGSQPALQKRRFSPRVTLAVIGLSITSLKLLDPVKKKVVILQKSIHHTPAQKLTDAFVAILAGARGLNEINTRVRSDEAQQRAFGRESCAEQSVVQETLDACTELNVRQMRHACNDIFRRHSATYRHNYKERLQLLDVDMTGMPCGPNQEGSRKGYFGENNIRYGRQLGRVIATHYEEIVVDQLFTGDLQLTTALQPLVLAAEETLESDEKKRRRTVIRVDAGGGSMDNVNWCLGRGYHFHGKTFSSNRAEALAATVEQWFTDRQKPERQVGWIRVDEPDYVRQVRRLALRWRKKSGEWRYAVLLSTLTPHDVIKPLRQPADRVHDSRAVALAHAKLYDLRGGGVEVEIKESKQGLGINRRSKKKFAAQQMVMLLGTLAHNVLVWARRWLTPAVPRLAGYGALRLVRDLLGISGFVEFALDATATRIVLNKGAPRASSLAEAFRSLLRPQQISVDVEKI